jgi:hypothetical protein
MKLNVIVLTLPAVILMASLSHAFETFEHRYIGEAAYQEALQQIKSQELADHLQAAFLTGENQKRRLGCNSINSKPALQDWMVMQALCDVPFGYGDIPALAGDYAGDVNDLQVKVEAFQTPFNSEGHKQFYDHIIATRRNWMLACNWLGRQTHADMIPPGLAPDQCLRTLVEKRDDALANSNSALAQRLIECLKRGPGSTGDAMQALNRCLQEIVNTDRRRTAAATGAEGYASSRIEQGWYEKLDGFIELVRNNRAHFPTHSWVEYTEYHKKAMVKARAFAQSRQAEFLQEAMLVEGWAQHFLQDSFSSGHIGSAYGDCSSEDLLPAAPLFCNPTKGDFQYNHDQLNALGLRVWIENPPPGLFDDPAMQEHVQSKDDWKAFGDKHLLAPEATFHRQVVVRVTTRSLLEVFNEALGKPPLVCAMCLEAKKKIPFPIPTNASYVRTDAVKKAVEAAMTLDASGEASAQAASQKYKAELDLADWKFGRSPHYLVSDVPLEGWKFLVTWGTAFGKYDELNPDGSLLKTRRAKSAGSFELGYIRPTDAFFNYWGAGVALVSGHRTDIYPISLGRWTRTNSRHWPWSMFPFEFSRSLSVGARMNFGVRLDDPFQQQNPTSRTRSGLVMSVPLDFMWEIYPPLAIYLRPELFSFNILGVTEHEGGGVRVQTESLFIGRGSVTFGLRMDLAGILGLP